MSITEDFKTQLRDLIEKNLEESNNQVLELLKPYKDRLYDILYRDGESLLHWACAYDNVPICKYLVENGLHVNLNNYRGTSPFYYACMNNAKNSIKFMLSVNVNPFQRSGFSGEFPVDILDDDELITTVEEYSSKTFPIVKLKDNILSFENDKPILGYKYRLYMNMLSNAFYLYNPNKRSLNGWEINNATQQLYENGGIVAMMEKCKQLYNDYFDELNNSNQQDYSNTRCLNCGKSDIVKRCSKCRLVYYCDIECQRNAKELHKFDCHRST